MITPADMARMMAKATGEHTQNPEIGKLHRHADIEPDTLLYTSESSDRPTTTLDSATMHKLENAVQPKGIKTSNKPASSASQESQTPHANPRPHIAAGATPTPAMMARIHPEGTHTTFASLNAQELPAVREYSAGGLIFDENNRVAVIARHSRSGHLEWCLPKGHIEKGETPEQTAVREIHEETGILGEVITSIATTDYWFTGTSERVHKLVHHFALRMTGGFLTVEGDPDHEAEDTKWVDFADLDTVLSYPNERKIVWLYSRKMNRQSQ